MSDVPLPKLSVALAFALVGAPFLVAALRRARRWVPVRARSGHRWRLAEALLVVLTPFLVAEPLGALFAGASLLQGLLATQLAFGATALVVLALATRRPEGLANLGLGLGAPLRAFLAAPLVFVPGILCALALNLAWVHLCRALGWEEQQEILRMILELERHELLVAALVAVLLGPWLEELLFRGFLQSALAQVAGERGAWVLTSALFAGLHGVAGLPVLFALSLFLGWLQQRTRSLWVPWSAHALNNAVMLALALALRPG